VRNNYLKLKTLGIDLRDINTVRFRGNESFRHRLIKFLISQELFSLGHRFKTEQPIKSSVCDVIDLDTLVIYEVESNPTMEVMKRKLREFYHPYIEDIVIVDIRKIKVNWREMDKLRNEVSRFSGLKFISK